MTITSVAPDLQKLAEEQTTRRARLLQYGAGRADRLHWYLLQCVGRSDVDVIGWLKKEKFETYYPLVREMRPLPRKKLSHSQRKSGVVIMRPALVPFFPRYLFVRFDLQSGGWRDVFGFAGVGGVHCEGDRPAPISNELIDELKAREIEGAVPGKTPIRLIFKIGEKVRVSDGPFAAFYGVVERLPDVPVEQIDPDTRIKVAVDIFGRATRVDLEVSQIEKL